VESEAWIEVPALAFLLRGASPNPSRDGSLTVTFTLPSAAPAVLDVVDLGGRRLASRAVGGPGPGRHQLSLAEFADLPSGIYVVRLRQEGREVSAKAVTLK
jgi:hypothetical protein